MEHNCNKICYKKWVEVNDLSSGHYSVHKNIRFKASMSTTNLCDYRDVYIVVKGIITVTGPNNVNRRNRKLIFKNNTPFRSCITKTTHL